jgi:hypothetical protein
VSTLESFKTIVKIREAKLVALYRRLIHNFERFHNKLWFNREWFNNEWVDSNWKSSVDSKALLWKQRAWLKEELKKWYLKRHNACNCYFEILPSVSPEVIVTMCHPVTTPKSF